MKKIIKILKINTKTKNRKITTTRPMFNKLSNIIVSNSKKKRNHTTKFKSRIHHKIIGNNWDNTIFKLTYFIGYNVVLLFSSFKNKTNHIILKEK